MSVNGRQMSTKPEDLFERTARLGADAVRPFPASRKSFVAGSRPDLRVGMREILQTDTPAEGGPQPNPPIVVYDTSGHNTDPGARIDLTRGLPRLREAWIAERGDTEELDALSAC